MKKTICKAIHEADESLFICIEDIHKVYKSNNHIIIQLKNTDLRSVTTGESYSYEAIYQNISTLNKVYQNIINELEEYHGLCSDK